MNSNSIAPILQAKDVEIRFDLRGKTLTAVRGASMDLYPGESLAIVGESGSGKSVFTKSLIGMLDKNGRVTGGELDVEGAFRVVEIQGVLYEGALQDADGVVVEGHIVAEFSRVKDAADWWHGHGYGTVKSSDQLNDRIKESAKKEKYIRGLRWFYRV